MTDPHPYATHHEYGGTARPERPRPHLRDAPGDPQGLTLLAKYRTLTQGHPVTYSCTEHAAESTALERLPRPSVIEIHNRHVRTREETWEFLRPVS